MFIHLQLQHAQPDYLFRLEISQCRLCYVIYCISSLLILWCFDSWVYFQAWRAATLCPFGGIDMFPSLDALLKNGKSKTIQAIELEGGVGQQWRLWKWASYCASEVNSRVCFFLFDIVLYMFKNCFDFSLTSLLWYTNLEYCYFRKSVNKMVAVMRWLYMLYSAVT